MPGRDLSNAKWRLLQCVPERLETVILVHRPVANETIITDSADESPVVGQRAYYSDTGGVVKIHLAVLMLCLTSAGLGGSRRRLSRAPIAEFCCQKLSV